MPSDGSSAPAFSGWRPLFDLIIPLGPSVNEMYVASSSKKRFRSQVYEAWKSEVAAHLLQNQAYRRQLGLCWPHPIGLIIDCERPSMRCDLDNRLKSTIDMLYSDQMRLFTTDTQVIGILAQWSQPAAKVARWCRVTGVKQQDWPSTGEFLEVRQRQS